jgi:hypothetical protein
VFLSISQRFISIYCQDILIRKVPRKRNNKTPASTGDHEIFH